jgi:hypothetical protein
MIKTTTRIVDADGRPTRELLKALAVPIISSAVIANNGMPTRTFSLYAEGQGVYLPPHMAIATADGLPTREFLNCGLVE